MRGTTRKPQSYSFNAILEYDPIVDGWSAYIPELATVGGATFGDTAEEAIKNMVEVVKMLAEECQEEGKPLPIRPEKFSPLAHVRRIKITLAPKAVRSRGLAQGLADIRRGRTFGPYSGDQAARWLKGEAGTS